MHGIVIQILKLFSLLEGTMTWKR